MVASAFFGINGSAWKWASELCVGFASFLCPSSLPAARPSQSEHLQSFISLKKKREEDESFCSVTKTVAFCAEQRFVWSVFSLEINFIETLYSCGELKASSVYRYFDNIARSQYLVTSRRDIFIQIWLLLFLILAGIRHLNRSTILRFLGGNAKRYN